MKEPREPYFSVGEVAILQPPHPSAKHLRGVETTILDIFWSEAGEDAMGSSSSKWTYLTDVPAPPPTDLPEDQHGEWLWCEYDLRKKHQPGESFEFIMERLSSVAVE
ncbi:MAG: hypothetical protein OQK04_02275 [Kangiellaceae bacterium]|nr:hypothetical protein [Kangiellaceae bacterium]MCW8997529.1 hypothetical protein [Kangiellaceae bacterium]